MLFIWILKMAFETGSDLLGFFNHFLMVKKFAEMDEGSTARLVGLCVNSLF